MTTVLTLAALLVVVPFNVLNVLAAWFFIYGGEYAEKFHYPVTKKMVRQNNLYLVIEAVAILVLVILSSMPLIQALMVGLIAWGIESYIATHPPVIGELRAAAYMKWSYALNLITIDCAIVLAF